MWGFPATAQRATVRGHGHNERPMRGHIARKGARYYPVTYEGIDPKTGREVRRWHSGHPNRRDAERALTDILHRMDDGTYRPPDRVTVAEYLTDRWLPARSVRLRPTTVALYARVIREYILPDIGHIPLQRLQAEDLDALYARLLSDGGRRGRGLAAGTVRQVHAVMSGALSDATRKRTVPHNVARDADAPPMQIRRRDAQVWTAVELLTFLASVETRRDERYPLWFTAAMTGMRRSEICGLRWRDVDLDGRRLAVRRQRVIVDGGALEAAPKTTHGERTIDLDARTVEVLRRHRRRQLEATLASGQRAHGDDYVFSPPGAPGAPENPEAVTRAWREAVRREDVPSIRLHDLRHTHASLMLAGGATPKVVQERLGHANIGTTIAMYQAVMPGMQAAAAGRFADDVFGATSGD